MHLARGPALGGAGRRARAGWRRHRRPRDHGVARATRSRAGRVRLPAGWSARSPARRVELDIFGEWIGGEVAEEPLFDPGQRAGTRLRVSLRDDLPPYDEAYDETGATAAALRHAARGGSATRARSGTRRGAASTHAGSRSEAARSLGFDPVPRILTEPEWSELPGQHRPAAAGARGVRGRRLWRGAAWFEAGVLTREEVESSPHYEPAMRGAAPRRWIAFAGLDVIRCQDGRFRVIEDQLRMPSGIAYAVAWRETLRDLLPVEPPQADVSHVFGELALALRDAAPAGTPGRAAHRGSCPRGASTRGVVGARAAGAELCAPVVTLGASSTRRAPGRVAGRVRPRAVDVVYMRTDEDRFTARRWPRRSGRRCWTRRGWRVAVVNGRGPAWPTTSCRGDAGRPGPAATWARSGSCRRSVPMSARRRAGRPGRQAARGEGGEGVVIWRDADEGTRERVRARIGSEPAVDRAGAGPAVDAPDGHDGRLEPVTWTSVRMPGRAPTTACAPARRPRAGWLSARIAGREQRPGRRREGHLDARPVDCAAVENRSGEGRGGDGPLSRGGHDDPPARGVPEQGVRPREPARPGVLHHRRRRTGGPRRIRARLGRARADAGAAATSG